MPREAFAIEYPRDGHRCLQIITDLSLADEVFASRIGSADMHAFERFVDFDEQGAVVAEGYVVALDFPHHPPHPTWQARMTVLSSGAFSANEAHGSLDESFEDAGNLIDLILTDEAFRDRYTGDGFNSLNAYRYNGDPIIGIGSVENFTDSKWREHVIVWPETTEPIAIGDKPSET